LTYDSYHRLCRTTEPESGSEVMAYDAANNMAWSASGLTITGTGCGQEQVAAAAKTTRTYDAMNRVKTILPPTGTQSTSYGYDPVGRMTSAVSGISTWNGTYNFRGLLTGESLQLVGQNLWALGYTHDANGSTSSVQYPDGEIVNYAPDALGRPTQAGFTSMRSLAEVLSDDNRALLRVIREQKPESLSQLAEFTGRAPSNLSRTLKTMERYGLVEMRRTLRNVQPVATASEFVIRAA
jgi:uncharacterized protein RhaS with RHS repeats